MQKFLRNIRCPRTNREIPVHVADLTGGDGGKLRAQTREAREAEVQKMIERAFIAKNG